MTLDIPTPVVEKKASPGENKAAISSRGKTQNKKGNREKGRTVEDVERDIEKAETLVKTLEEALSQAALQADAAQLTQLSTEYEQARIRVDALLEEWERLADVAS